MSGDTVYPPDTATSSVAKCFDQQRFLGFVELKETNTSWILSPGSWFGSSRFTYEPSGTSTSCSCMNPTRTCSAASTFPAGLMAECWGAEQISLGSF